MSAPSCERVFGTPELLEMIILKVPIKDILVNANRVCKHWNTLIQDSTELQQALFFSPLQNNTLKTLQDEHSERHKNERHKTHAAFVVENPFYIVLMNRSGSWRNTSKLRFDTYSRKDASWRRMLPCQPPMKITTLSEGVYQAENPKGVTFQDIEDVVKFRARGKISPTATMINLRTCQR